MAQLLIPTIVLESINNHGTCLSSTEKDNYHQMITFRNNNWKTTIVTIWNIVLEIAKKKKKVTNKERKLH